MKVRKKEGKWMKCNRCGAQMREKDVITGEDQYGDPLYSRYAFCDQCRIKRKLADDAEPLVPERKPPKKTKKRELPEELPVPEPRKKKKKKKGSAAVLNTLILILGILNIVLILFIVFVLNKHNLTSLDGLKSILPFKSSAYTSPLQEEQIPDWAEYGVTIEELHL